MSLVIPLYNAASKINSLWSALFPVLSSLEKSWEVIFVDDGSSDDTSETVLALKSRGGGSHTIRLLKLKKNYGQQAAVYCGIEQSRGELIITMDDDLQHPAPFLVNLIEESKGYELVYALPESDERSGLLRFGSYLRTSVFRFALKMPENVTPGSFRLLKRSLVNDILGSKGRFVYVSALIFYQKNDVKVKSIEYPLTIRNKAGTKSRFSLFARARLLWCLVYHYALLPERSRRGRPYVLECEL